MEAGMRVRLSREKTQVNGCAVDGPAADTLGLNSDGWVLVRPDGYLAARGHGQDHLDHAYHRLPL
jgi:6-methylpretetramide 4-monooxygenase / 4-hydroxy-6-methylpretetramide 12a-monooxygenase